VNRLSAVLYNPLRYRQISCDFFAPQDAFTDADTSGSSGLHYDATANQYIFTWQTESKFVNKCFEVQLDLDNGTQQTVRFKFTK
jgi:hypothetical protein